MGKIVEVNKTGDQVVVEWDQRDAKKVKEAERAFNALLKKGFLLYELEESTTKTKKVGKQLKEFNASSEKVVARPAMQGG